MKHLACLLLLLPLTFAFTAFEEKIPYDVQSKKMPEGNSFSKLLPARVGSFQRKDYKEPGIGLDGEATYTNGKQEIFMLFSLAETAKDVKETFITIHQEVKNNRASETPQISIKTNPAYIRYIGPSIAFFAWSRGLYCFSADSKGGDKKALDEFMKYFPY